MKNRLFEKVAWCATDDSNSYRCNLDLLDWLLNMQHYSKRKEANTFFPKGNKLFLIEEKYWLREEEFDIVRSILQDYQRNLAQMYFTKHLRDDWFMCKLTGAEYFMFTLEEFLRRNECNTTFFGKQMYTTKEYKDLGCWGTPLFEAKYELTDFAVAYHKMYLIAQAYCLALRKNPYDKFEMSYINFENTKNVLDTREIEVSRF